jgi:broad specificity phosphatase PhoE
LNYNSKQATEKNHREKRIFRLRSSLINTGSFSPFSLPVSIIVDQKKQVMSGGKNFVVVARHGERQDDVEQSDIPQGDPPLSEHGKRVSQETAELIKSKLPSDSIFHCRTSPFLRCRETAEAFLKANILREVEAVVIDNELSEVYGPIRIKTPTAPNPWQPNSVGSRPEWPESLESAIARMQAALVETLRDATEASDQPHVYILCTHGDMLDATFKLLFPKRMLYSTDFNAFIILEVPTALKASNKSQQQQQSLDVAVPVCHGLMWLDDDGSEQPRPIPLPLPEKLPSRSPRAVTPRLGSGGSSGNHENKAKISPVSNAVNEEAVVKGSNRRQQPSQHRVQMEQRGGNSSPHQAGVGLYPVSNGSTSQDGIHAPPTKGASVIAPLTIRSTSTPDTVPSTPRRQGAVARQPNLFSILVTMAALAIQLTNAVPPKTTSQTFAFVGILTCFETVRIVLARRGFRYCSSEARGSDEEGPLLANDACRNAPSTFKKVSSFVWAGARYGGSLAVYELLALARNGSGSSGGGSGSGGSASALQVDYPKDLFSNAVGWITAAAFIVFAPGKFPPWESESPRRSSPFPDSVV